MVDREPPAVATPWVAVVTGANSGIGQATARELARRGATTILACRNQTTAASAARTIRAASGNEAVHTIPLDLADLHSVTECAQAIRERAPEVDLLVNNAGGAWRKREVSAQGIEATFAVNHLGHYALTRLLLDELRPGARVVNVTSEGHRFIRGIHWDDIGFEHGWRSMRAYAQAKLAQILFTRELARRAPELAVQAVHPGFVYSNFYRGTTARERLLNQLVHACMKVHLAKTVEQGAETPLHVATTDDPLPPGGYWAGSKPRRPSRAAQDDASAKRLWEISQSMIADAGTDLLAP